MKSLFGGHCGICHNDIKRGEEFDRIYIKRNTGEEISVMDAYNLRATEFFTIDECHNCIHPKQEPIKAFNLKIYAFDEGMGIFTTKEKALEELKRLTQENDWEEQVAFEDYEIEEIIIK